MEKAWRIVNTKKNFEMNFTSNSMYLLKNKKKIEINLKNWKKINKKKIKIVEKIKY